MKEIELGKGYVAIVDNGDYENVSRFKWRALNGHGTTYAVTNHWSYGKNHLIYMHRWLMKVQEYQVDHIDGNGLNNRRENLRVCTQSENQHNRHSIGGIVWDKAKQKYLVRISKEKKTYFIGRYKTLEEAQAARDAARKFIVG